jgi:hypothetical protein
MESYRIPKDEVSVEIAFGGSEPEEVSVFLGLRAASHPGRERPSDLLFGDDPFLTVKGADGSVRFINKDHIAWMTVAPELEMSGRCVTEAQLASERCRPIDVLLDDGRLFVGEVAIVLPDASSRLQDFLNSAARFVEVRNERAVHFVNRDRVVMVKSTE